MPAPPTVVLVHGAWHGAWCWEPVLERLATAGVPAIAVELPLTGLHDDADAVWRALDQAAAPVVLVGHSYGGAVITEAGAHPATRHLVVIAGFPLHADESAWTVGSNEPSAASLDYAGRLDLASMLTESHGSTRFDPDGACEAFYDDCRPEVAAWASARLRATAWAALRSTPRTVAWHGVPSTYVVCSRDRAVHPGLQRILARRTTARIEWPTSHSPFLSRPGLVARCLGDLAGIRGSLPIAFPGTSAAVRFR